MRKEKFTSYLYLCLLIFTVLSFSDSFTQKLRFFVVSSLAPSWSFCENISRQTQLLASASGHYKPKTEKMIRDMEELKRENQALCEQMENSTVGTQRRPH